MRRCLPNGAVPEPERGSRIDGDARTAFHPCLLDPDAGETVMDAQTYTTALAELRALRDEVKKAQAALARLESQRDEQIFALAGYENAKAERSCVASCCANTSGPAASTSA